MMRQLITMSALGGAFLVLATSAAARVAVGVAAEIDRHAVDEQGDVGPMVGVESADEVLVGLPPPLMLADDEPGNQPEHIRRPPLGAEFEVFTGDQLLGRGADRRRGRQGAASDSSAAL